MAEDGKEEEAVNGLRSEEQAWVGDEAQCPNFRDGLRNGVSHYLLLSFQSHIEVTQSFSQFYFI